MNSLMLNPLTTAASVRLPPGDPLPARALAGPAIGYRSSANQRFGFILFLLVNASLFIRPAEVMPEWDQVPSYDILILLCLAVSLPTVLQQLDAGQLAAQPISVYVLGLLIAFPASQFFSPLHMFYFGGAWATANKFLKILVYYLLLVALVDTPRALRQFLFWLNVFILVLTTVTLLQYHKVVEIPTINVILKNIDWDDRTGEIIRVTERLQSMGVFNDPNDFCLILVVGIGLSLYWMTDLRSGPLIPVWAASLGAYGYALYLTQSRGGFLAMLAGMLAFIYTRFGGWRAACLSAVMLPVMFMLFAGRSTELSTESGTGRTRLQLWAEAFALFREAPLFGIGEGEYQDESEDHSVVHNSYLHSYTELGFFGGTLFFGGFYFAVRTLLRLGAKGVHLWDPELRRLRPFLVMMIGGYAVAMLSLSRNLIVPTYMILGLGTVFIRQAACYPPLAESRFSRRMALRLVGSSAVFLVAMKLYTQTFVRWG